MTSNVSHGKATLWVNDTYGDPQPIPFGPHVPFEDTQVVMLQVVMENSRVSLMFNRGDFSSMVANPNDRTSPVEIAIAVEEF